MLFKKLVQYHPLVLGMLSVGIFLKTRVQKVIRFLKRMIDFKSCCVYFNITQKAL